jgi:hypothetical protein
MAMGKCFYNGCSCLEFVHTKDERERYIPTKAEVIAAGYTPEAADRIIERETKAKEVWE